VRMVSILVRRAPGALPPLPVVVTRSPARGCTVAYW
jgi:hypothetical protein